MTIDDFIKNVESLPTYVVEIGVFTEVKREPVRKKPRKMVAGKPKKFRFVKRTRKRLTNAELLYIQEHGTAHIPQRPVLGITYRHVASKMIPKLVKKVADFCKQDNFDRLQVDRQIDILSQRSRDYAKNVIASNDGRLVKNAASTIRQKGFDHPLFRTGQLQNSIDGRYYKLEK